MKTYTAKAKPAPTVMISMNPAVESVNQTWNEAHTQTKRRHR